MAEFLCARVYVWDGKEACARRWHLLIRRELNGTKVKYCLCNAGSGVDLHELARMQGLRFFVEQSFKEVKSTCGMAEYQCRKWDGWHHHMSMVMIATMFLAKERLALRATAQLLSCERSYRRGCRKSCRRNTATLSDAKECRRRFGTVAGSAAKDRLVNGALLPAYERGHG